MLKNDAHFLLHGGADDQLMPVDMTTDNLNGDAKTLDQEDIRDLPLVSKAGVIALSSDTLFHPVHTPIPPHIHSQFVPSQPTFLPLFHQNKTVPCTTSFAQPTYQIPPLHYFLPSPSHSPSLPGGASIYKILPIVTHIPFLNSKTGFFHWNEGVQALICANGLIGHILDPFVTRLLCGSMSSGSCPYATSSSIYDLFPTAG